MNLKQILQGLEGLDCKILFGNENTNINKIEYDSRKVENGDLFVCIEGFNVDGHKFVKSAIKNGAKAILCQKDVGKFEGCTVIKVKDTRKALAVVSANFYEHPEKKLKVIGITGTNGKTTSTFMIKSILEKAGFKVGLIGTIANYIGMRKVPTHRTTPESLELFSLFDQMVKEGVKYCVMEVSAHSLSLDRVYGINFDEGIFTNLTRDHLDFYKTFENYYNAKLMLFKNSKCSVINIDDEYGRKVYNDIGTGKLTYSVEENSDVRAQNLTMSSKGVSFDLRYGSEDTAIKINIPGKYNVYNALGSIAACLNEGISLDTVKEGLKCLKSVPGRCELVSEGYNLDFDIIVDYAHTPDGLQNILKTAREFTRSKLISVFGCGGDRDRTKRPVMGNIGAKLSDIAVITSDNPRSEDPQSIIDDIVHGVDTNNYKVIVDRREAIKEAIKIAGPGDVIVIAGKGHEDYQILKNKVIHFDEREIVDQIIKELF